MSEGGQAPTAWNYGIRKLTDQKKAQRRKVLFLRKMQMLEAVEHQKDLPRSAATASNDDDDDDDAVEHSVVLSSGMANPTHGVGYILNGSVETEAVDLEALEKWTNTRITDIFAGIPDKSPDVKEDMDPVAVREMQLEVEEVIRAALKEALREDSLLLYHPASLVTDQRKIMQIHVLDTILERVKERFNKSFNSLQAAKETCVANIMDKNKRLKEILEELGEHEELFSYTPSAIERPETTLEVDESLIKAEKVLTEAQKKALEEQKNRERNSKERFASQERALVDMMNGTLAVKKEESYLDKDIVPPAWLGEVEAEDMTVREGGEREGGSLPLALHR